jgi:hypothetical protein
MLPREECTFYQENHGATQSGGIARTGRLQGIPESEGRHRFGRPGIFSPEELHRSPSLAAKRDRIPEKRRRAASLT